MLGMMIGLFFVLSREVLGHKGRMTHGGEW